MTFFIPAFRSLWTPNRSDEGDTDAASADAPRPRTVRTYAREAAALLLIATGLYCALALASYEADPLRPNVVGENWVGPVGEVFARLLVELIGVVAWLIPVELVVLSRPLLVDKKIGFSIARLAGDIVITIVCAALAHVALPHVTAFGNMPLAGVVGDVFGEVSRGLFSTVGSFLIGTTVIALILMERATFSFIDVAQRFRKLTAWLRRRTGREVDKVATAWAEARAADKADPVEPVIASPEQADAIIAAFADDGTGIPSFPPPPTAEVAEEAPDEASLFTEAPTPPPAAVVERAEPPKEEPIVEAPTPSPAVVAPAKKAVAKKRSAKKKKPSGKSGEPKIVDTSQVARTTKAKRVRSKRSAFELPDTSLLDPVINDGGGHSSAQLKETARPVGENPRRLRRAGIGAGDPPRPDRDDVRGLARARHQGEQGKWPRRRPRAGAVPQGAHHCSHPGQGAHRLRGPQRASFPRQSARARREPGLHVPRHPAAVCARARHYRPSVLR